MPTLSVTHESTVTEEQIDHLGHMNVRFYGTNARTATESMLGDATGDGLDVALDDIYTRHHREQLQGARLEVRSGFVEAGPERIRIYHELANRDDGALAATFVHGIRPGVGSSADALVDRARAALVEIPEHGGSRSISLDVDPLASAPDLSVVSERGLAMRRPRAVQEDECDEAGDYIADFVPMLTWAGEPIKGLRGDMLHDGPDGEKMGWAAMESRIRVARLPRLGDRIQSFGALIEMRDKTTHHIHWVFDLERDELLTVFESVSLAFDTVQRRAMSIPDDIRNRESAGLNADLAPKAATPAG